MRKEAHGTEFRDRRRLRVSMGLLLTVQVVAAARADDEAALALADQTPSSGQAQHVCRGFVEGALEEATERDSAPREGGRLSMGLRCDGSLSHTLRAVVADRADGLWQRGETGQTLNTLKEAYLSWQARADEVLDLGRINARQGVGSGYNPTDFLRADAIREETSPDPGSLRENRLGTVMARSQTFWTGGSFTALYAPELASHANSETLSPDFGATNPGYRWSLALSQTLEADLRPQFLMFGEEHESPQLGVNLTRLIGNATVAYVEWSGGRQRTELANALADNAATVAGASGVQGVSGATAFESRLATGLTYSTAAKVSMTLEFEYNGAAPGRAGWDALRDGSLAVYGAYRDFTSAQQDLVTRRNLFAYANWQDALVNHLDLTVLTRFDPYDHSHMVWAEARYHRDHLDVAAQWQRDQGAILSDFGGEQRQLWVAVMNYHF